MSLVAATGSLHRATFGSLGERSSGSGGSVLFCAELSVGRDFFGSVVLWLHFVAGSCGVAFEGDLTDSWAALFCWEAFGEDDSGGELAVAPAELLSVAMLLDDEEFTVCFFLLLPLSFWLASSALASADLLLVDELLCFWLFELLLFVGALDDTSHTFKLELLRFFVFVASARSGGGVGAEGAADFLLLFGVVDVLLLLLLWGSSLSAGLSLDAEWVFDLFRFLLDESACFSWLLPKDTCTPFCSSRMAKSRNRELLSDDVVFDASNDFDGWLVFIEVWTKKKRTSY